MNETLALENLIAVVAGLAWITACTGPISLVLCAVPGSLLLAGGVSTVLLPGDPRTPQLTALGAVFAFLLALPLMWVTGFAQMVGLLALAAGSFVACGWTAQRCEPPIERVPQPELDLELAAKVAFDQLALATIVAARPRGLRFDVARAVEELREARALFERSGWLEKPASYHETPPPLESPILRYGRSLGLSLERLSFASGYEPHGGEPGRERWLERRPSEYVHGRLWFTPFPTEPVGWLIEQAGDDLFLFSSDYPHPEGGRDPLGRFEESLAGAKPEALDKFYCDNFAAMMGS